MATARVQREPFDIGAEMAALTAARTDIGGIGCFVGCVRADAAQGKPATACLVLEDYPAMTRRAMERIAAEAERRWSLLGCTVIHRVGALAPGAAIVLVLAAASHRQAALDATAFLIDWLKTRAPFWKKECLADGTERWVEAREADAAAASRWVAAGTQ
jgi:molybdopterin synthase catalytic subunit